MRSPFSTWGWAGVALLILGITLLIIGYFQEKASCSSPSFIELIGSIASITALIWIAMDNRLGMLEGEMRGMSGETKGMKDEMRGLREETRGLREEMREGFEKLPKRIAEELRELLKK
ncbi:MAG: hypothetical protein QMD22_01215 [archaeon]|nr:hypothetical protein [archaeon]